MRSDGDDARYVGGRLGFDASDERMGLVGEDEPGVKQARDRQIGGEARLPTDLRFGVTPGCRDADRGHSSNVAASPG